jgi:excinuclease UvrABC nuclease subunit
MPWNGTTGFQFNRASVLLNAPEQSGVYALFNEGVWVYIGEAKNIRDRLLQHLTNEENACVARSHPQWFAYELVSPVYRVARQDQLILELHPTCNKRLG